MFVRRLSPLFVLFALTIGAHPATGAPSAPASAPSSLPSGTNVPMAVPKAMRVRMELEVLGATDGVGSNSEDEIYYFVVQPQVGDTLKIKEVRRNGDPDVFEMGPGSDSKLSRWLFRGEVSKTKPMRLGLLIAEQDASDVMPAGSGGGGVQAVMDPDLLPGMNEAKSRVQDRDHQLISFVQIKATPSKLDVTVRNAGGTDSVLTSLDDYAKVKLEVPGSYRLHIYLEPDTGPAPKGRRYLGVEDDDCNENKSLSVVGTNGDVSVGKGQTKLVDIGAQEFKWYCGGSDESSVARPNTNLLEVVRKSNDDEVLWRCFKKLTLSPDVSW